MKDPVKQFAVIGGYVICCTEDEKLIRCDMSTGKKKELADHIQYFFAGAKLYAQKGSKIVSVSYDGEEIRVFKKDVVMMDKKEDKIYYRRMDRKKEQMYVCDVDGGMEGWRRWLETKLGKIETNDNAPDFCLEHFYYLHS